MNYSRPCRNGHVNARFTRLTNGLGKTLRVTALMEAGTDWTAPQGHGLDRVADQPQSAQAQASEDVQEAAAGLAFAVLLIDAVRVRFVRRIPRLCQLRQCCSDSCADD